MNTTADTPDANVGDGQAKDAQNNTSLRAAIQEGNSAGGAITITFQFNLAATISLGSALPELDANFTIVGSGANSLTVTRSLMAGNFRILDINSNSTSSISALTISNGRAPGLDEGGGIYNAGSLTLSSVKVVDNTATGDGGGVYNKEAATLIVSGCDIYLNTANASPGGGIFNDGTLQLNSASHVFGNNASYGGGIYNTSGGTVSILGSSEIYGNSATFGGGGIYNAGNLSMTGGTLEMNSAGDGAGYYGNQTNITITFTNVSFTNNTASSKGGGFYLEKGDLMFDTCTISGNSATTGPGGVYVLADSDWNETGSTINDAIASV